MTTTEVISMLIVAILWLISIAGHLVLLKILLTPRERVKLRLPYESSWLLLLSIAAADLVALLLGLPFTSLFFIFDSWETGLFSCNMSAFVKSIAVTVSSYCIVSLLMQCYEMVVTVNRTRPSILKQYILLGCIWALALFTAAPLIYFHQMATKYSIQPVEEDLEEMYVPKRRLKEMLSKRNGISIEKHFCYHDNDHFLLEILHGLRKMTQVFIPLVIVVFLFIKVADSISKKAVATKQNQRSSAAGSDSETSTPQQQKKTPNNFKFVHLILTLSVIYCLSWTVGSTLKIYFHFSVSLNYFVTILQESVFFIKPFCLFAVNSNFQNALRTIGVASANIEDIDSNQEGFSKMDEEDQY